MTNLGAIALTEWLAKEGLTASRFCARHQLDKGRLSRIMTGTRCQRISVDFAHVIHEATGGEVEWSLWTQWKGGGE